MLLRQEMPNKYGRVRPDKMAKHKREHRPYVRTYDETGKVGQENMVIRAFWRDHKMSDIIKLTAKELDKAIESSLEAFRVKQSKNNPQWWYPEISKKTFSQIRYKKKVDKEKK